ncbi:MAG: menaquinone biosynthetic enzyme MqnA/MqnD family protein [Planctomycetota bacterium]
MKTRIGCVPYLNARPLALGLVATGAPYTVVFKHPRKLGEELDSGLLMGALAPAVLAASGGYEILPSHGIISRGQVGSVHLYSRKEPSDWQTVFMDVHSMSSVALTEVLCRFHFKNQARVVGLEGKATADAYLLIGDQDMAHRMDEGVRRWDLGEEWQSMTGLPFLYAAWVVSPGLRETDRRILDLAYMDPGSPDLEETLPSESARLGLSVETLRHYLTHNIHYNIDKDVLEGFRRYLSHLSEIRPGISTQVKVAHL